MDLTPLLAERTKGLAPSPIRALVPLMRQPGMISFGGGYPNPATFAFGSLAVTFRDGSAWRCEGAALDEACQYGPTPGDPALLERLRAWQGHKDGVDLSADRLLVLTGSQEGLHLLAYLLLEPGDAVLVSEPAYPGALGAFAAFSTNFIPVPLDEQGERVDLAAALLAERRRAGLPRPKLWYTVPSGHNPAGVTMTLARRQALLALADEHDLLVLEDDPYQLVRLDAGPRPPTLQSLDRQGRVVRLDSFSKIFAPGLRLGYLSGPAELVRLAQLYKQTTTLHTPAMTQALLAGYLATHDHAQLMDLIGANCRLYRTNRDRMVAAARRHLPELRFTVPSEGMFLWLELPAGCDAARMVASDGVELKVLLVPGSAFSTTGGLRHYMRASFSTASAEQIEQGMQRLAQMLARERARLTAS